MVISLSSSLYALEGRGSGVSGPKLEGYAIPSPSMNVIFLHNILSGKLTITNLSNIMLLFYKIINNKKIKTMPPECRYYLDGSIDQGKHHRTHCNYKEYIDFEFMSSNLLEKLFVGNAQPG